MFSRTEERKLGLEEKPLLVQLNWHIDDREGRFLLRRIDDKTNAQGVGFAEASSFRRKLSKREKKQMKKQEKLGRLKSAGEQDENAAPVDQNGVAEKLYTGESSSRHRGLGSRAPWSASYLISERLTRAATLAVRFFPRICVPCACACARARSLKTESTPCRNLRSAL
jgi:hypothetical protein